MRSRNVNMTAALIVLAASSAFSQSLAHAADFWSADKVQTFHVTVAESDWKRMQPERPSRWRRLFGGGNRPPATQPADGDEPRPREQGPGGRSFGFELPYVFCTTEFEGTTYDDIGIRFKGNSSYAVARQTLKKPFKLDFNRYLEDGAFREGGGVTLLNFNNNAMDPSQVREALAYKVFRDAGVPAPRTAFARVYLTVPGVHERTYLGLYTVIEEVNKQFLKDHFDSSKGLLLKPEGVRGFKYLGNSWRHYDGAYDPRGATRENTRRFIEFLKLVDDGSDEQTFRDRIGALLDLDAFARFLAANVVLSNTDSFLATGHNYYLYLDPKTDKLHFVPWDLNLAMGGFMLAGNIEQQADLSIDKPHVDYNNLVRRLLAVEGFRARYRDQVKRIIEHHFNVERTTAEFGRLEALVSESIDEEKQAGDHLGDRAMGPWRPMDLPAFIEARVRSIEDQLAGRSTGTPPMPYRRRAAPASEPATEEP